MCTSIAMKTRDFYFGRNMDLEYDFGQRVVITPRSFPFAFRRAGEMQSHYAMIGMASVADGYPLYAEAMNEKGLGMAGLNFPDNAYYPPEEADGKANVSPFELIPWVLGQCETVAQARQLLEKTHLIAIPFSEAIPLATLHWHIADAESSLVLESTREGMKLYDNPVGVLTNNPPFDFQLTNLRQYLNLTPLEPENRFSAEVELVPFGRGFGGIGLPGDFSPASRFVKAAFLRQNSVCDGEEASSVSQFFHLLDAVAMPKGIVAAGGEDCETTRYACCISAKRGIFYYKTYANSQLTAVDMRKENLDGTELLEFPLVLEQQVAWANG